jgi:hypothetical protein
VLCLLLYTAAGILTSAYFMGDTVDYAQALVARASGGDYLFWEFGHLLWRPVGYVLFRIFEPLIKHFVGPYPQVNATIVLLALGWIGGLVSVLSLFGIVNRVCRRKLPVWFGIAAFTGAQAFLNYFHTGTPYIPGLGLVLLAMFLLVRQGDEEKPILMAALAGASLAGAGLFWLPYVLAIPAALLMPLVLFGFNKQRLKVALIAVIVGAIVGGVAYFAVMGHVGIHNMQEFRGWVEKTSRSTGSSNKGISRAVFGFARSFVNMGNDGMLFKRFLLHDPFNPVTVWSLFRFSLWKLLAFYLFLGFLLLSLISSINGRRMLVLLMVNVIPVIAFAIYWQGGDPERYLPLYPLLFMALTWTLDSEEVRGLFKFPLVLFVIAMIGINCVMLSRARLQRQQKINAMRISELEGMLKPNSWIYTANWQDELVNFNRSFPLNPVNRNTNIKIGALISPGEPQVARWRQEFSTRAQSVWANGGDVWISRRLLTERPKSEWNWVEGDDRRVSWTDLYRFAARLEFGESVGGDDGFVLVPPSEQNKKVMEGNR